MTGSGDARKGSMNKQPTPEEALGFTHVQTAHGISEYVLNANGLKVVLMEDHSKPVFTYLQMFRVGSRNEKPAGLFSALGRGARVNLSGTRGVFHFLEHLFFKGTEKHNPEDGTGVFETFAPLGMLLNATTFFDRTCYFECVSAEHFETCVEIEADRMRNLLLRPGPVENERGVVLEEMSTRGKDPERLMFGKMFETAFTEHPYRWTAIGIKEDVETVSLEQIRACYSTYCWPNNGVIIFRGAVEKLVALAAIARHYGQIPRSPEPIPIVWESEPPQQGERRFEVRKSGDLPRLWLGYHVPESSHDDTYALAVIARILGGSSDPNSRLYSSLVENGLVADAGCTQLEFRDPGLFTVETMLTAKTSLQKVEELLLAELDRLAREPVSEEELAQARDANRTSTIVGIQDPMTWVKWICEGESAVGDWRWQVEFDDHFDKVTADDVMRVAGKYFAKDNRTVGIFIPTNAESDGS